MSRTTRRTFLLVQPLAAAYLKLLAERQGLGRSHAIEVFPGRHGNSLGDEALVEALADREPCLVGFTLLPLEHRAHALGRPRAEAAAGHLRRAGRTGGRRRQRLGARHPDFEYAVVGEGDDWTVVLVGH